MSQWSLQDAKNKCGWSGAGASPTGFLHECVVHFSDLALHIRAEPGRQV